MFTADWTDPIGRLAFIWWLFSPFVVLLLLMALGERRPMPRVRRFWCRTAGREVEATFVANHVCACTAFDPASAIGCERSCHSAAFRGQWKWAVPVFSRRRA
jgi:hypothetical protein